MSRRETKQSSKCTQLESPKRSYDALLFHINYNFGEKEKDDFEFAFRNDLPRNILEDRNPLKWFNELERREMLSPDDLSRLENFLQLVSLNLLLKDVRCYTARRKIVLYFQGKLERQVHGLCLDDIFGQSWTSNQQLSRNFLKKCQDLFRRVERVSFAAKDLSSLLSNGVKLLENSCRPHCHDLNSVATKILYLSNLVFQRFGAVVIEHQDLFERFSPRPSLLHRGGRSLDVPAERQSDEPVRSQAKRRASVDLLGDIKWIVVGIFVAFIGSILRLIDWWEKRTL